MRELQLNGYQEIKTPLLYNKGLWEISGHWGKYKENMFLVLDKETGEHDSSLKPMNCPSHYLMYSANKHSYRELPIRYTTYDVLHRNEVSGALSGLTRVRQFQQDDCHIFLMPSQIADEVKRLTQFILSYYSVFGLTATLKFATRPEVRIGDDAMWDAAEGALRAALEATGLPYELKPGDGAFYGPKIDFDVADSIGRTWQLGTIQLDYNAPERFDLKYVGDDNHEHRPVVIHRAVNGSFERFIAILIEHFAGVFPVWLAPEQVRVLPISDAQAAAAHAVADRMRAAGLRVHGGRLARDPQLPHPGGRGGEDPVHGGGGTAGGRQRQPGAARSRRGQEAGSADGGGVPGTRHRGSAHAGAGTVGLSAIAEPVVHEGSHEGSLQRLIGVRALALTAMNTTVGAGIFGLPALIAADMGASAPIGYIVTASLFFCVVLCFAEAGSRVSSAGGLYAYSNAAFGPFTGSFVGTLLWFGNGALSNAAVAVLMVNGLSLAFPALAEPFGRNLTLIVVYTSLAAVNVRGLKLGLRVTEGITVIKLLPLILLAVVGLVTLKWSQIPVPELPSTEQLGRGVVLLTFTFMGIETALSPSAEIRDPTRVVPRGLALALLGITLLYFSLQLVAQGALGAGARNGNRCAARSDGGDRSRWLGKGADARGWRRLHGGRAAGRHALHTAGALCDGS